MPVLNLRIVAVRKGKARFLDDPHKVYMAIREKLNVKQTTIDELFWCTDPIEPLDSQQFREKKQITNN